jgi:glycosyltransferase involved in cell wall biosynthesis
MKVLYFHQHFVTPRGSGGSRSYAMACKLIKRGHQVTMVSGHFVGGFSGLVSPFIKGVRRGSVDGIDLIEFDLAYSNHDGFIKRFFTFLSFVMRSLSLVFSEKYDIILATSTPLTAGIPGILARWLRGKLFIFEVRDLWPELPKAMGVIKNPLILWSMSILEWITYKSAHRLIGLSPGIVEGISRRGISKKNIALIPNGCDLDIFFDNSNSWRPRAIKSTDFMAIFAGTHGVANGLDALLDVAKELKKRKRKDIKILLVGEGKLKAELQSRARRYGLINIIFHDSINKPQLAGLFSSADLGIQCLANVSAFYYGTSPNKFFDYIAAGLPVLNNYPGWISEIITQHQCGFSIEPNDSIKFAEILEWAADNKIALRSMGQNSKKLAKTKFNRELLSNQWVDWVEGAITI